MRHSITAAAVQTIEGLHGAPSGVPGGEAGLIEGRDAGQFRTVRPSDGH